MQNKFGTLPLANLKGILLGFCTEDVVCETKWVLHDFAVSLLSYKEVGKLINRKAGDGKLKLDNQDLLEVYGKLDKRKIYLLRFVAANLSSIHPV